MLRAIIRNEAAKVPYFEIQAGAAPAVAEVLSRNTDEDWTAVMEAEWQRPFDYQKAPLMRLLWLKGKRSIRAPDHFAALHLRWGYYREL